MGEIRKYFGRIKKVWDIPNLIDIQTNSYEKFLQQDIPPAKRENFGLQGAFKSVFPITDFSRKCSLEFVSSLNFTIPHLLSASGTIDRCQ